MSKRTIRIIDLYCHVANWNDSIASAKRCGELDEAMRWSKQRDRKLARLRSYLAALTPDEQALIRRRYAPDNLARQLRSIGVEPN